MEGVGTTEPIKYLLGSGTGYSPGKGINILIIGQTVPAFEDLLVECFNESLSDYGNGENAGTVKLNILTRPQMDTASCFQLKEEQLIIDYVVILVNDLRPDGLSKAEMNLKYIDPIFFGKKRVDFFLVKRGIDEPLTSSEQLLSFCKKYKTFFRDLRIDDTEAIKYQAGLTVNKAIRIYSNPLI